MLEIGLSILLAVHLLAMNVASAGPLAAAWLLVRGRSRGDGSFELGRRLMGRSLGALAVGSLLGGALCFTSNPSLWAALERFPIDAYWFAGVELLFSAACIGLLWKGPPRGVDHPAVLVGVALLSATNLIYHFPPLMAVIGELTADPRWTGDSLIDRATLRRLWSRPEILATWAHFAMASMSVAPLVALWPTGRSPVDVPLAEQHVIRRLAGWSLVATVLQIPVGLWLLASTRPLARAAILGESLPASLSFAAAMLTALMLMQTLLALTLGDEPRLVRRAGWLVIAVTVLMTATLRFSRIEPAGAVVRPPSPVRLVGGHVTSPRRLSVPAPSASPRDCRRAACSA